MHDRNGTSTVEREPASQRATKNGAAAAAQLIIRALERLDSHGSENGTSTATLLTLVERLESTVDMVSYKTRLLVKEKGEYFFVSVEEIEWLEAEGNYVRLHVEGGGIHLIRASLSDLESQLDPGVFLRIHRGAIVNLDRVVSIQPHGVADYRVLMRSGRHIGVGRTYRDTLLQRQD